MTMAVLDMLRSAVRGLGALDRDQAGAAAARPAVMTAMNTAGFSVRCCMVGQALSRCWWSPPTSCSLGEDLSCRLRPGPQFIEPWSDMVSHHFPLLVALVNSVARPVVWRRLAVIAAAWLLLVSAGQTADWQTPCSIVCCEESQWCCDWASRHGDRNVKSALSSADACEATWWLLRRWKPHSGAQDSFFGCFWTGTSTQWFLPLQSSAHLLSSAPVTHLDVCLRLTNPVSCDTGVFVRTDTSIRVIFRQFRGQHTDGLIGCHRADASVPGAFTTCL